MTEYTIEPDDKELLVNNFPQLSEECVDEIIKYLKSSESVIEVKEITDETSGATGAHFLINGIDASVDGFRLTDKGVLTIIMGGTVGDISGKVDNPNAFPISATIMQRLTAKQLAMSEPCGMDLLDHFAGLAMQAEASTFSENYGLAAADLAKLSYERARAMLDERNKE